jgi:hypothetical protein
MSKAQENGIQPRLAPLRRAFHPPRNHRPQSQDEDYFPGRELAGII